MIAKYPARCRYCGNPIEVGRDEYDPESRKSWHLSCADNPKPGREQFELAARLGFIGPDALVPFDQWRNHKVKDEGKPRQSMLAL